MLLQFLACPECAGEIVLSSVDKKEENEIIGGELFCESCAKTFEIIRGVPHFAVVKEIEKEKADTAENFGWQWQKFTQEDARYKEQFLGWIQPVTENFFKDKIILEAGCGKGRHTMLASEWGAKEIIGVDLSAAVETAFEATRNLPNAHIVQADIYHLPFKCAFDYAFSVGVLHHLPNPRLGFLSLSKKVKAGGHLSAWIYGAENNKWLTRFVNPVRKNVTSLLNKKALFHLSKLPASVLFTSTKLIYAPLNKAGFGKFLFYNDYMKSLSAFGWREQHNIVFDHLVAPTAYYISREDFEFWWREIGADEVTITWHNQNSWCGFGKVK